MLGQRLTKGHPRLHSLTHGFEGPFRHADAAHAVVNAPRTQPPLGNFEASSFPEQHVRNGHANIFKRDLAVPVRRMVIAKHRQHALNLEPGAIHRHQHHRLLFMERGRAVCLFCVSSVCVSSAHKDRDLTARIARSRGPPLAAINDILVALPNNTRLDVGCIR